MPFLAFSPKQKVYSTDSTPINESEDVGVEGKRYPTHALGRFVVRYPVAMFLTVLLPFAFFIVGCARINSRLSYTLDNYQIRSTINVRRDALKINDVLDNWSRTMGREVFQSSLVNTSAPRAIVQDTVELRAIVSLPALFDYAETAKWDINTINRYASLLSPDLFQIYHAAENWITGLDGYTDVCFTNNLQYGLITDQTPVCAPVSSMSQYLYPVWSDLVWNMNGSGVQFQLDYTQRLFVNPNYKWFFDNNFSSLNQRALQLRSQFTFASTRSEPASAYRARMKRYLPSAMDFVNSGKAVAVPFVDFYMGGGSSQNILLEIAADGEGYKVGVAVVVCLLLSWWHCGTFVMGLYTAAEAALAYMAAVGLYSLIYETLPLTTYSAIIWVMTFCMHGTLSFYDMFVFSGIMATKGRQNNLSVAQRLCFTMRRVSVGVWIADVLAIVIFAINTTSLFSSVEQFSVFMMIALLWNMYCVVLPTPALVVVHHMYFSNKRRNLQKQNDVLNEVLLGCRRPGEFVRVLEAVQDNVADGERTYWMDDDLVNKRIGTNRGINKKRYGSVGDFLRQQVREGVDKVRAARRDVVGAVHKASKTKEQVIGGSMDNEGVELPAFTLQDFLQVGDANPLAEETGVGADGLPLYYNPRMVFSSDLIHIPAAYVERSEDCWAGMCNAVGQPTNCTRGDAVPPSVYSLGRQGTSAAEAEAFAERWREVGTRMGVETTSSNRSPGLVPLAVRNAVRAQDPKMVVDPCGDAGAAVKPAAGAAAGAARGAGAAGAPRVTGGPSGMGLAKLRYRWAHRADVRRSRCCGLFGHVADESPEQRMRRLMARKVKREGYSLFERFLLHYYLPAIYSARYAFVAVLFALFIVLAVTGSRVSAAGLPNTLLGSQTVMANKFALMDDTFGQRGTCTFCGPYYRSLFDYRQATATDIAACSPAFGVQMNLYADSCGVCNGTDACVDCTGTANGTAVLDNCGGCTPPWSTAVAQCTCSETRDCPYCEWALNESSVGGGSCSVTCGPTTCGSHGSCNQYTGTCDCAAGFTGATCNECESWLLPITSNPGCTLECSSSMTTAACNCNALEGTCTSCPAGTAGYQCNEPPVDCGSHGTYSSTELACACASGWTGTYCNVSTACSGRGVQLSAAESPTGAEMCGCVGHWRGATCQVCDCLNGGMCDNTTGQCSCVGAFTGPRCETCAASCTLRGTCPSVTAPDYALWNVRTCIPDACTAAEAEAETMCSACTPTSSTVSTACNATDSSTCMSNPSCWWYSSGTTTSFCGSAVQSTNTASLNCMCTYPKLWSGPTCDYCPAPSGATCLSDGTVLGCNGLTYTSLTSVVSTDICGVCGGNGLCRGCDGVPGSGMTYDSCGVCGGNNTCIGASTATPMYVDYLFDLTGVVDGILKNANWCKVVAAVATNIRLSDSRSTQTRTVVEDYLAGTASSMIMSLKDFYNYVVANGRLSEAIFTLDYNENPLQLKYIRYRVETTLANSETSPGYIVGVYYWIQRYLISPYDPMAAASGVSIAYTSTMFQPAVAKIGALQSLWFAVGIGLAVTFVFLLVYYVSVTTAAAATMVASIVCLGSLTVCTMFDWEVDAVLQVCISCTVPIGVEYVVHFCSGYFDYLQTTTSHLFARDVTRRTAVQGALLRSAPAVCTSAMCVIVVSIMFDVSDLVPSKRAGQVSITLHLLVLLAGVCFTGAVAALGPMKAYQHWTISTAICAGCAVLAAIAVLIMYAANGVRGPHANRILTH